MPQLKGLMLRKRRWRKLYADPLTHARINATDNKEGYLEHIHTSMCTGGSESSLQSWTEWVDEWRTKT